MSTLKLFLDFLASKPKSKAIEVSVWLWIFEGEEDYVMTKKFVASSLLDFAYKKLTYFPSQVE